MTVQVVDREQLDLRVALLRDGRARQREYGCEHGRQREKLPHSSPCIRLVTGAGGARDRGTVVENPVGGKRTGYAARPRHVSRVGDDAVGLRGGTRRAQRDAWTAYRRLRKSLRARRAQDLNGDLGEVG